MLKWIKKHLRFNFFFGQPDNIDEIVKERRDAFTKGLLSKRKREMLRREFLRKWQ